MASMITATTWVPRGHAAAFPTRYVFDEDEYARISKLAKLELDDAKDDLEEARQALSKVDKSKEHTTGRTHGAATSTNEAHVDLSDDDLKEYDLEHYDDELEGDGEDSAVDDTNPVFQSIKSLAYHTDNSEDPYLTLPEHGESDDEEREDLQILPTDNLVLAARVEDEVAHLEICVYEDEQDNLYVHHDVMLPAVPLCVEWIGNTNVMSNASIKSEVSNTQKDGGNFAAIGTMDPEIEIWDLDVVDCMYPHAILGESTQPQLLENGASKKKKKKKSRKANDAYHIDAVLSLAANRNHSNLLASASADKTVKLWDLNTCTAATSYSHHTDKVCALAWHPTHSSVLLSGSYDRTVVASDMRAPNATAPQWGVESDVEQVKCDPHNENHFYVSTENGILHCSDARTLPASPESSKALWRLQAHDKSLSSFSLNPTVPGFIATGSQDRTVKLWNVPTEGTGPSLVTSRDLGVGKVFSANFAPDSQVSFRLAVAGSKGSVQVWDTSTNKAVREAFASRVKLPQANGEERLVGLERDDEPDSDEEDSADEGEVDVRQGEPDGWESMEED